MADSYVKLVILFCAFCLNFAHHRDARRYFVPMGSHMDDIPDGNNYSPGFKPRFDKYYNNDEVGTFINKLVELYPSQIVKQTIGSSIEGKFETKFLIHIVIRSR